MGGQTISTSSTRLEALQVQSSVRGACIPWVRGRTRITGNLAWFNGFTAVPHTESQGGKGGGTKVKNTTYTYNADVIMGLCHGPIIGITTVWRGKGIQSGGVVPSQIETATESWTVPASGAMTHSVTNAGAFLCMIGIKVAASGMLLAQGKHYTTSSAGVVTVLDDTLRSVALSINYQWRSSTISHTALAAMGLSFLAGHIGQAAWSGLAGYPTESIGYSGLAAVAGQDYDLGESAAVENHKFEVVAPMAYHLGDSQPDIDPALFAREILVDVRAGASFPAEHLGQWGAWSDYCVSAGLLVSVRLTEQTTAASLLETAAQLTNAAIVTSSGRVEMVPYADQAESGNGRTYTPDLVPIYDLDDECWEAPNEGEAPLKYRLKSNADRYNHWRLDYSNRLNQYESEPVEAKDDADIQARGLRTNPSSVNAADWVCSGSAARKAVQVMMQRSISVLAEYEAALPWHYAMLEPMDIVTLTDDSLGLDRLPARVIAIEENDAGDLTFTFEDCPIGAASAAVYGPPDGTGFVPDYNADPGDVDAPVILEGPAQLAGTTGIEVWIGVRGSDPNWGGAHIWTSLDDSNYKLIGTVNGGARYGQLSAAMTTGSTSLAVDGLGDTQLSSGSADDRDQLVTLCFVGGTSGEFLSYQTATLTGAGAYTLSSLKRGAYGSPSAAHVDNAPFCRLDDRMARSGPLDASMIGQALYIKCTSFNIYGAGAQGLADVDAIAYTVTGQPASYYPGVGGKGVTLKASSLTFQYPKAGGVNPSSITLTAERKGNLVGTAVFSVVAGTATLTGSGDTRTLTAANLISDTATIRVTVTDSVAAYTSEVTISKVREGLDGGDGASAPLLRLALNAQTFTYDGAGSPSPTSQTISATANLVNLSGTATFVCTRYDNVGTSLGTVTMGGSGNTRTLTIAQFSSAAYATIVASLSGQSDTETVVRLKDGATGADGQPNVVADLDNQAVALPADSDGVVSSYAGATTRMKVYIGLADDSTNWTFTKSASTGITAALGTGVDKNLLTVTAMSTGVDSGYVDITATRSGFPTQVKRFSIAKSKSGPDAPLLRLSLTAQTFTYNGAGSPSPSSQTISATANLVNLSGTATFVCTRYDSAGSSLGTVTMGGSGNTRTLTVAQFGSAAYATIVASLSGQSDTESVVRLKDGADGSDGSDGAANVVADLDNQAVTLPADSDGVVSSYSGAATRMKVYIGLADDSTNWTFSKSASTGITAALGTGADKNLLTLTAMSSGVDSGYVDITATRSGFPTQVKRFSIAKSKSAPGTTNFIDGFRASSSDVEVSNTSTARASVALASDGGITRLLNDVATTDKNWWFPNSAGIGSSYWVRATFAGPNQDDITGDAEGTWLSLGTDRSWDLQVPNPDIASKSATIYLTFSSTSTGSSIIGGGVATLFANRDA